jgi:single-strand DNA-binding protein
MGEPLAFPDTLATNRRLPTKGGASADPRVWRKSMSRSVNKIILVGNVGQDPDIHETGNGTKVAHFSLATNRRTTGNGEEPQERADWHRLTLWNRLAQFAQDYVSKGDRVYVEGRLEYDSYDRDGVTIPTADVNVRELVLLSPRPVAGAVD